MIGRLTGIIVDEHSDGSCVIEVGGVGYDVSMPLGSLGRLNANGDRVTLHIHTHVREDALLLYGFATPEDRAAFRLVLSVSGVGPKIALAIVGNLDAQALSDVVARQDAAAFKSISGVGKKTAERLLLELKDKLPRIIAPSSTGQNVVVPSGGAVEGATNTLVQLGFKRSQAERAVADVQDPEKKDPEELLKAALSNLG